MHSISPEKAHAIAEEIKAGARLLETSRKHGVGTIAIHKILCANNINYGALLHERMSISGSDYYKKRYGNLTEELPAREDLIREVCEIITQIGRTPRVNEIKKIVGPRYSHYVCIFGNWANVFRDETISAHLNALQRGIKEQRIKEQSIREQITKEQKNQKLIEYLKKTAEERGYPPTKEELLGHPVYNYMKYHRAFGGLRKALELAGLVIPGYRKAEHVYEIRAIQRGLQELNVTLKGISIEQNAAKQTSMLINKISGSAEDLIGMIRQEKYKDEESQAAGDTSFSEQHIKDAT